MDYQVRYTKAAKDDLVRLYSFLVDSDIAVARKALEAIEDGVKFLEQFPFSCRKASEEDPLLREMIISFGSRGYVVLFSIDDKHTVTILAVRHQREDDLY
ncbi:MAG: type II toxin-antitoxin system RelE/ParE family toxin [Deltaproteobacteria bacterium]|nr:type II toxin-antitoxin system RelE/ParE family toxin [Deltaproteobacteria bacterium]